ncbi:hypothetical protein [Stakelama saccharophila]|uniref:Uncharacterized protein n=1 Tax=Stakelama saccharophila TaxID=3075605 RepID=A0ABZ0B656_9SPHN|nr:hypothetical protein [Stakelama sp. W311]WNO52727.1 hypothetical protein RPR59_09645 [Stakelama sp. W311]
MRLLLFLTALLTGLSGAAAAERTAQPTRIERAGLASVVTVLADVRAVAPAHRGLIQPTPRRLSLRADPLVPARAPLLRLPSGIDQRRLE